MLKVQKNRTRECEIRLGGQPMKKLIKYTALCLIIGSAAGTAQAKSQAVITAAPSACAVTCEAMSKTTRRIVRVEAIPAKKIQPSAAYNGKYLAKLNTTHQAYGKVLVPVRSKSRTPNYFRPLN